VGPNEATIRLAMTAEPASGGPAAALGLGDLPERARDAVRAALRRSLFERRLPVELRRAVEDGRLTLPAAAAQALEHAVRGLAADQSLAAVEALIDLADLVELTGAAVPFDAQTELYRVRLSLSAELAGRLDPAAWRLGFAKRWGGDD
jgi:hypothetical protein